MADVFPLREKVVPLNIFSYILYVIEECRPILSFDISFITLAICFALGHHYPYFITNPLD